jgi:hypothetical protein
LRPRTESGNIRTVRHTVTTWPEKGEKMKGMAKLFAATLGFGALGFILSLFPQKTANGVAPTPVDVTNTPLPVKGDVGATILGTPSVKVTSLPPVAVQNPVANGAATPLVTQAADNPALQPFQAALGQASAFPLFTINVPAGKTLVIEEVNMNCNTSEALTQAQEPVMLVDSTVGGVLATYTYAPVAAPPFTMIFDQLTHIYADGGSAVIIGMQGGAYPTNNPGCQLELSGHFVSKPVV